MTESWATEVRACPWPQCDSASGQLRAKHACMYILIELARHARMCKNLSMHDSLLDRQMHNYIYFYSAHTIGEMLMIACMQ